MSESLRDLVVSLSLQTDNFTRNMQSVNKQIKEAESSFKLASAGVDKFDQDAVALGSQLGALQSKLDLQKTAVDQYARALEAARGKLQECYSRQTDYAQRLEEARQRHEQLGEQVQRATAKYEEYKSTLGESDSATIVAKQNLDALKEEFKLSGDEVKKLSGQNEALRKATQNAADAVTTATTRLNNAQGAVKETESAIDKCNQSLSLSQTNWYSAGEAIQKANTAITSIGKQMQLAESKYRLATAGLKNVDKSAEGLSAKLTLLQDKLTLQEAAVEKYKDALQGAQDQLEAARQANDPEKIQQATDAVTDAEAALNRAQAAVRETREAITETTNALKTAQSAWTAVGNSLTSFSDKCEKASKAMTKAGRVLSVSLTAPIVALGKNAIESSLDFESSFTSVRKTVDATEAEFADLAAASKKMSTEVAASTDEINEVMATGGQLGIATKNLTSFTKVMIDLGNSCEDLSADEAATSLAKFANVMKTDQKDFERIGSTLVDLGNNYATTEKAIMEMSQRLAGAGKQVGLTEAQVMGFAAALSSVGIEAQMGGSAFSKALVKMEVASATGGEALEDFGKVAGMTGKQFKTLWDSDPASAFQAFIAGLAQMDEKGMSAIATLQDIGISEVRLRDTLLRATNATELFANTQVTANKAWKENSALATEANKRYATTASKITNLKNKATLFAQQLGDDMNPTIQSLIEGASGLLDKFLGLDEAQRKQIITWAAVAASIGPALLAFGKITKGVGAVAGGLGKFATAVGAAGGGFSGFLKVLGSSPAVWAAVAVAVVAGTAALYDYVSGAKDAREALKGMEATARKWKETAADSFYGSSQGLSFFGMSTDNFKMAGKQFIQTTQDWLTGLNIVWSDGQKETDATVKEWTDSWKALTEATRSGIESLKTTADKSGYSGLSRQMKADLSQLNSMDKEIEQLLKKRKNKQLTEKDQIRLQELVDTRNAISIRYNLVPNDSARDGFNTLRRKMEAEVARAEARGQEVAASVYENAVVAAAEGMATANKELDAQYDTQYALIQLMTDEAEKSAALAALNAQYNADRKAAAQDYAAFLKTVVTPVWEQDNIQEAKTQVNDLMLLLRQYSAAASDAEKKEFLPKLNQLTSGMNEGSLAEYIGLLTQIQSLMDNGMSRAEVESMFPDIDFSGALEQLAAIQTYLNNNKWDTNLTSLNEMFGTALGEEALKIATDLDMTGAQARWNEWASNPGSITTDAVIQSYTEAENAEKQQPLVDALIAKYTEQPQGADKASLSPAGLVAYVQSYAEATTGTDVSALNPTNVTALVNAYKEVSGVIDVSMLKPSQITAYVSRYLENTGADTTGLTPSAITAFVMAYEEITGGASTAALTPKDVSALVVKYSEAENVDVSALKPSQIEALVSKFAEATGCDKTELLKNFTAYITEYKEVAGVKKPTLNVQVGLQGYDLMAYRKWLKENKVEVEGIVRLSEVYENPVQAARDAGVKFWKDGAEIPVTAITEDMLRPENVAVLDKDGTMHVLVTAEISGAPEAIAELREQVAEVDKLGMTKIGTALTGIMPTSLMGFIDEAEKRIESFKNPGFLDFAWLTDLIDANARLRTLDTSMQADFNADNVAELSTYVAEIVKAIQNGEQVSEQDMANLQKILQFVQELDSVGVGANVTEGIAEGMTAAGWDASAETVASNLEAAINAALLINSPSERTRPAGEYAAAGIGEGMSGYDFSASAEAVASAIQSAISAELKAETLASSADAAMAGLAAGMTGYNMSAVGSTVGSSTKSAVSSSLNSGTLRPIGVNAMAGLRAGIVAGTAGVVSAMRSAARSAVNAAKTELKINSPSKVFKDEVGVMVMKGMGKGVTEEAKRQARVMANAARYLTGEAREGALGLTQTDNRKTYNQQSSVNLSGNTFYIRDEQDIRSLAVEIASLTKRKQQGKGLRLA